VNHGLVDAVVRKYTSDGTLLWARQPGTPFVDQALAVATDGAGSPPTTCTLVAKLYREPQEARYCNPPAAKGPLRGQPLI